MSASASNSDSKTTNQNAQVSTQGASGAESPTVSTTTGNVTVTSDGGPVTQSAIAAVQDVVEKALQGAGAVTGQAVTAAGQAASSAAAASAAGSLSSSGLVGSVLSRDQNIGLATATGGQSISSKTTLVIVLGVLAVVAIGLVVIFRRK